MKTGFKELDNIIDIEKFQVILLTSKLGVSDVFSGDIANNVCLNDEIPVLEIVRCKKEYLIKRMLVNQAKVDYKKWTLKDKYSNEELQQIGQSIVNLIEVTKRLPTIIEESELVDKEKQIKNLVFDFANSNEGNDKSKCLIILDLIEFNSMFDDKYRKTAIRIVKYMKKISNKLHCTIIITNTVYNKQNYDKELELNDIKDLNKINKYIDTIIIMNNDTVNYKDDLRHYKLEVYQQNKSVEVANVKYDNQIRQFKD